MLCKTAQELHKTKKRVSEKNLIKRIEKETTPLVKKLEYSEGKLGHKTPNLGGDAQTHSGNRRGHRVTKFPATQVIKSGRRGKDLLNGVDRKKSTRRKALIGKKPGWGSCFHAILD